MKIKRYHALTPPPINQGDLSQSGKHPAAPYIKHNHYYLRRNT
jgi:hypothetical protein